MTRKTAEKRKAENNVARTHPTTKPSDAQAHFDVNFCASISNFRNVWCRIFTHSICWCTCNCIIAMNFRWNVRRAYAVSCVLCVCVPLISAMPINLFHRFVCAKKKGKKWMYVILGAGNAGTGSIIQTQKGNSFFFFCLLKLDYYTQAYAAIA